ncbi:hypothetical protein ACHAP8_010910 [Fusarium lateritium]
MIYVSALFSAMMALAVDGSSTAPRSDQMFVKIRRGLLALKQFEQVYNLARWIRNFFMDILNRSETGGGHDKGQAGSPRRNGNTTDMQVPEESTRHLDNQEPANMLTGTISQAGQPTFVTSDLTLEDATFMLGQDSNDASVDGGGFWPTYLANGVFPNTVSGDAIDFPQPDSTQYQAMYFLADLGIANVGSEPVYEG